MAMTFRYVLTQYLMRIPNDDNATLLRMQRSADKIAYRLKETFNTFDFIQLLNRDELLDCFLHQLTLDSLHWHVIFSILSVAKLMYERCIMHDQDSRVNEIIDKVSSFMANNDIESWIENQGGWQT